MCCFFFYVYVLSHVPPWAVAHQTHLSMEFFRQEHWSGLPFPAPGDLPDPGIEPASSLYPAWAGDSLALCHPGSPEFLIQ